MDDREPLTLHQSSPPLAGERVTFTGTLASMTHREAAQLVNHHGGSCTDRASRKTTLLVVGEEGWPLQSDGTPSLDFQRVRDWQAEGSPVRILNESEWLHLIGLQQRREEIRQLHTPASLARLLDISVHRIRSWERAGLIKPVHRVHRLPYFDFQEVTGVRRLTTLLEEGIRREKIEESLRRIEQSMPGIERPLAQLELLARGKRVLYRDPTGLVEPATGQRFLDFESDAESDSPSIPFPAPGGEERTEWSADDWWQEGLRLLAEDQPTDAVEAFRICLMERSGEPEPHLHLAESLYRIGKREGALERYYCAVEVDHEFVEAWTQLGCLLEELEEPDAARVALEIALRIHEGFADAHLHLANLLDRTGQPEAAIPHWRAYLDLESRGPWAEQVQERLTEIGFAADSAE